MIITPCLAPCEVTQELRRLGRCLVNSLNQSSGTMREKCAWSPIFFCLNMNNQTNKTMNTMKKMKYESQLRLHQIAAALGLRVKDLFEPID